MWAGRPPFSLHPAVGAAPWRARVAKPAVLQGDEEGVAGGDGDDEDRCACSACHRTPCGMPCGEIQPEMLLPFAYSTHSIHLASTMVR